VKKSPRALPGARNLFERISFSQGGLSLARPQKGSENWGNNPRFNPKNPLIPPFSKEKREKRKIIHICR
jgi:hypothetical protein